MEYTVSLVRQYFGRSSFKFYEGDKNQQGFYMIVKRKMPIRAEDIIYVGETGRSVAERLREHDDDIYMQACWVMAANGVEMDVLVCPFNSDEKTRKSLEQVIIASITPKPHCNS